MADFTGPVRVVGRSPRRAARGPGPAVVIVLLYAAIFAAALWWLKARSPLFQRRNTAPASAAPTKSEVVSRSALLSGEDLSPVARDEYFRGLSARCCPCGCEANLRDCLLTEESCATSPELAREILEQLK
jgi:hypothetical protein